MREASVLNTFSSWQGLVVLHHDRARALEFRGSDDLYYIVTLHIPNYAFGWKGLDFLDVHPIRCAEVRDRIQHLRHEVRILADSLVTHFRGK